MPYKNHITHLHEICRASEDKIRRLESSNADENYIETEKNQLDKYYAELSKLDKLQWIEDHERINIEDDR
jgi:hypothetical protein